MNSRIPTVNDLRVRTVCFPPLLFALLVKIKSRSNFATFVERKNIMAIVSASFETDRKLLTSFFLFSAPEDPPRKWTHPCTCTLVAHEQCLLKWIQTSQGNASRAPNALKCPQCGTTYELESNKPIILRIFSAGNRIFQQLGRYFTVIGTLSVIGVVGTSTCLSSF